MRDVHTVLESRNQSRYKPAYVDSGMVREFLVFCSAMFVTQFSGILISGMDLPIVVAFDFRSAAYYAVATTLSNALIIPHGSIVSTIMPVAAGISSADSPKRLGEVLQKTTRFATAIFASSHFRYCWRCLYFSASGSVRITQFTRSDSRKYWWWRSSYVSRCFLMLISVMRPDNYTEC